jgi:uncharacterized delta-60 repeat protein
VVQRPDGKLVSAGECNPNLGGGWSICMWRYNTDGSLDTTFDGDGRAYVDVGAGTNRDGGGGIALQPDGKIVAAGWCDMGAATGYDACVTRVNANGTLDATFDGDGRVSTPIAPTNGYDEFWSVVVQPDGKILASGDCNMGAGTGYDVCMARYTTTGALDTTFGTNGIRTVAIAPAAGGEFTYSLTPLVDGSFVVAGNCAMGGATGTDFCLAQFSQGGAVLDYANGSTDWDQGGSAFGACLRSIGAGTTAQWSVNAGCPTVDGAGWNPIPTSLGKIAYSSATGTTTSGVSLRWGLRPGAAQTPGTYVAPVVFDVTAPNV